MPKFAPGDRVHIAGLGTGIIRESRNGGRYLVEIKGATMVVPGSQLEPPSPERRARNKKDDTAAAREPDPGAAMGRVLAGGNRRFAGATAPAAGLYLWRVEYPSVYGIPAPDGRFW